MFVYICVGWVVFFVVMKCVELLGYWDFVAQRVDVTIRLCYLQFQTTKLNDLVATVGTMFRGLWRRWFSLGMASSFVLLIVGVSMLVYNVAASLTTLMPFWYNRGASGSGLAGQAITEDELPSFGMMTPLIPGVNLPVEHVPVFFLALLISGIFHELGHAIAAAAEGVRLKGFGVFVLFVFPGAFASISNKLLVLPPLDRIKVFAAGAFHNVITWLAALCLIFLLPWLLSPAYARVDEGVTVTHVEAESPVATHIRQGDRIVSLNRCSLQSAAGRTGTARWSECFEDLSREPVQGFCLSNDYIVDQKDAHGVSCCFDSLSFASASASASPPPTPTPTPPPPPPSNLQCFSLSSHSAPSLCASARAAATGHHQCSNHSECKHDDERCAVLVLNRPSERLVKIVKGDGEFVLYAGELSGLWYSLQVSDYQPRFGSGTLGSILHRVPGHMLTFLQYLSTLSLGLAVLNMVPAFRLDGQLVFESFLHECYPSDRRRREQYASFVLYSSTTLLAVNVVLAFLTLYYRTTAGYV